MTSGEEKGTSQSARLEVDRSYAQMWTSTQTDVNKEDVRMRTNETETMGAVEKEKVQCSSGHWERCLGQFLNKMAGNCTHFAEVIKGAIKVGTGKKLYSVVICPG